MFCIEKNSTPPIVEQKQKRENCLQYCMLRDNETGKLVLANGFNNHFRVVRNNMATKVLFQDCHSKYTVLRDKLDKGVQRIHFTSPVYKEELLQDVYQDILENGSTVPLNKLIVPDPYELVLPNLNFDPRDQHYPLHKLLKDPLLNVVYYDPYEGLVKFMQDGILKKRRIISTPYYYHIKAHNITEEENLLCVRSKRIPYKDTSIFLEEGSYYNVAPMHQYEHKFKIEFDTCYVVMTGTELSNYFVRGIHVL